MANFIVKGGSVLINAVDLTADVESVQVTMTAAKQPVTSLVSVGEEGIQGLRNDQFVLGMQQDLAASAVDATLQPLFDAGTAFLVKVRASSAAVGPTNPSWEGTVILYDYPPFGGNVGDLAKFQITLEVNGKISRVIA